MSEEQKSTALANRQPKTLKEYLDVKKPDISAMLPSHINIERFLKSALLAVARDPKLQECTPASLFTAVVNAAELGLDFVPAKGQAYLIKYGDKAQFMVGFKGMMDLAKRGGQVIDIQAHVVYEKDTFEIEYGSNSKLTHKPTLGDDTGAIIGAYCIAELKDGSKPFEFMKKSEITGIQKRSKAANNGPWQTDWTEMARKTVIRRLCKYLPSNPDLDKAIEADNKAIGLAEFSIEPLEDGEKTSRLADRLAEKITPEVVVSSEAYEAIDSVEVHGRSVEPPKRGRPPKQEVTVSKTETVAPEENYVELLQDEMRFRDQGQLVAARKALTIPTLNIQDLTQQEAKYILLWLEKHAEKGE